jgi:hypothetical protein
LEIFSKLSYSSIFSGNSFSFRSTGSLSKLSAKSFSFCSKISTGLLSKLLGKSFSSRSKGTSMGSLNLASLLL